MSQIKEILTKQEFINQSNKCKFKHVYEDQEECLECGISCNGDFNKSCPKNKKAYKKYKKQFTNNNSLFVMMQSKN